MATLNFIFLIDFILYMSDHELIIHLIFKKNNNNKNPIVWNFFQRYMLSPGKWENPSSSPHPSSFLETFLETFRFPLYRIIFMNNL